MNGSSNDDHWHRLLADAGAAIGEQAVDPSADVRRGRARLRRRRVTSTAGGTALALGVAGIALVAHPGDQAAPTADHATTPTTTHAVTGGDDGPLEVGKKAPARSSKETKTGPPRVGNEGWRREVFGIVRQHLDPQHRALRFEDDLQSQSDTHGTTSLGTKMTWRPEGTSGGGMVQISVSRRAADPCGSYSGYHCRRTPMPGGASGELGRGPDGMEVRYRHPDGEIVDVYVSRQFGNNGTSTGPLEVTEAQLFGLVQDDRLKLPAG